jgi:hypothetical protein
MTKTLTDFLLAPKPDWVIPAHVSIMSIIIAKPGQRQDFFLQGKCGLHHREAISRALKNLLIAGWITKDENDCYTAVLDKLPKGTQ